MIKLSKPESVEMCSKRLSRINEFLRSKVDSGKLSCVSTLIARRGKIVHHDLVGYQDRDAKTPVQLDTLFRWYSMTKPIVCTAFMTLYEQGKCDLREPVANYIPSFASLKVLEKDVQGKAHLVDLKTPMTIHHLLTHTSGLGYDFYEEYPVCKFYREHNISSIARGVSLEQFIDKLSKLPLAFQPGEHFFYGVSIDVVGRLIEIISGKPLDVFLKETIFDPLSMKETSFFVPENKRGRVATVYGGVDVCAPGTTWTKMMDLWEKGVNKALDVSDTDPIDDPAFMRGGFGLKGTIEDYFAFTQMLLNGGEHNNQRILSPKTVNFMHMDHLMPSQLPLHFGTMQFPGYSYGLGSRVNISPAHSKLIGTAGEYGWAGAARTYYYIDPKEQMIGIFMTQLMADFSLTVDNFRTLAYQAIV
ncbi:MAG: serine hydrolase [Legionellaceae bacterium]|nr:serine hydrolase [Legionellaceae bacterium]